MNEVNSIKEALGKCRKSLIAVGVFSLTVNFLMLTPLFFMLNVFDKAVSNNSFPTLYSLIAIALFLYIVLAGFEWLRSLILVHIANRLDHELATRLYDICFKAESGLIGAQGVGSQPLSDLHSLRQFIGSPSMTVVFDLPWVPLLFLLMFAFHPALAAVGIVCLAVLTLIAIANQRGTSQSLLKANKQARAITGATERNLRNAEVAAAMGMMGPLSAKWRQKQTEMLSTQVQGSSVASGYAAIIKTLTLLMQSIAITTGASLVILQEISPGVMIVAALLLGKCLQPIQQAVSGWTGLLEAREQYRRLNDVMSTFPPSSPKFTLPSINGSVICRNATVVPPGGNKPTLAEVNLDFPSGSTTVVLGGSGAGKSTLVRAILGIWPTVQGEIRIDGAKASDYGRDVLGPQLGYLPQDIELFDGTVADNIARFSTPDHSLVFRAAEDAGIKDLVLSLPKGFDTIISGSGSGLLSPGQRQRIALARAVYGHPKLLLLDEPNSNLDQAGEDALASCLQVLGKVGSTIILVSHRPSVIALADYVVMINNGRVTASGPKAQIVAMSQDVKTSPLQGSMSSVVRN